MNSSRTLWMGNIENWMNKKFILSIFESISKKIIYLPSKILDIIPIKINLLIKEDKKSSCFIEFDSQKTASAVLKKYNNQTINNVKLKLNWVNSHNSNNKNKEQNNINKYTVYLFYNYFRFL